MKFRSVLMSEAGEGDAGGGDPVFDGAPALPKGKLDGALPSKPVKPKAEPKPVEKPKPKSMQERRNDNDDVSDKLAEHIAAEKAKAEKAEGKAKAKEKPAKPAGGEAKLKDEPAKKPAAEPEEDDAPEPRAAKPKAPPAKPEPKDEAKPDPQLEGRLVRAMQDLRNSESVTKQLKADKEAAVAKVAELEKKAAKLESTFARAKDKKGAYDFFHEVTGLTLRDLVDGLESGEIEAARPRASVPPEIQEQMEALKAEQATLKAEREEREKERAETEKRQRFDAHLAQTKKWIEDNLDDYPALARIPWAAQQIVQGAYQNGGQLEGPAQKLQDSLIGDLSLLLDDEKSAGKIGAKLSDETKAKLAKAWGFTADNDNDEDEEVEPDEEEEDEDDEPAPRKVAVKPHVRKPASRVSSESTPRPKPKSMDRHERAEFANSLLTKFIRQNKSA